MPLGVTSSKKRTLWEKSTIFYLLPPCSILPGSGLWLLLPLTGLMGLMGFLGFLGFCGISLLGFCWFHALLVLLVCLHNTIPVLS